MIDFIICDNDSIILKNVSSLIQQKHPESPLYQFSDYDEAFLERIYEPTSHKKIYILDIEAISMNGLDVARLIRKTDENSIIIFLTGHQNKYNYAILKIGIRYDCVINKEEDYLKELDLQIDKFSELVLKKRYITFVEGNITYEFLLDDILYFTTNKTSQKTVVQLSSKTYEIRTTLKKIESNLPACFIKTHRACIVNQNRIKNYDYKQNIIYFDNNKSTDLVSRSFKKNHKVINQLGYYKIKSS